VTKYYIPANTHFEVWYFIMNKEVYDDLSPKLQEQLKQVASEFENRRWESAEADQKANEQRLADFGAKIVNISDAEIAVTAKKIQAEVWPVVLKDVGEEWGQGVLDAIIR